MHYKDFGDAYRFVEPTVTDENVRSAFLSADTDRDFQVSWREFENLFPKEDTVKQQDKMPLDAYWSKFSSFGRLDYDSFMELMRDYNQN